MTYMSCHDLEVMFKPAQVELQMRSTSVLVVLEPKIHSSSVFVALIGWGLSLSGVLLLDMKDM